MAVSRIMRLFGPPRRSIFHSVFRRRMFGRWRMFVTTTKGFGYDSNESCAPATFAGIFAIRAKWRTCIAVDFLQFNYAYGKNAMVNTANIKEYVRNMYYTGKWRGRTPENAIKKSDSSVSDFSDADEESSNDLGKNVGLKNFAMAEPSNDNVSRRQATRVFKKSSANGKITVYLGKRDFVDHLTHVDPIDGVVLIDPEYVRDRKVFGHVLAAFRYGREDLDVLGLTFRKDLYLAAEQIYPPVANPPREPTRLQERLIRKLGSNAYPFYFELPPHCPASVTLQPAPGDTGKPCGVDYELKAFVGETQEDKPHKRNSVRLAIRKIMYAPSRQGEQPSVEVSKEFLMSPNRLHLEASLDKELYHHGETIAVNVHIANNSNRTVKKIKVTVRQFADICLFSTAQYKCVVAEAESDIGVAPGFTMSKVFSLMPILDDNKDKRGLALDGQLKHEDTNLASSTICPVGPGFTLSKVFSVTPLHANNKDNWALALDGQLKHEDTNLASSTLVTDPSQRENLGIIVQYKVKVKLILGTLGGELVAELPFILMHPKPEEEPPGPSASRPSISNPSEDGAAPSDANLIQLDEEDEVGDDDIIFEDFARLRLKGETDA